MKRVENITMGIDFGSESVGIGIIDTNENHIVYADSCVWKRNTSIDKNAVGRIRREYLHASDRLIRMRRLLRLCNCLPDSYCEHFNWEPTETDRGIGTLKKTLNKVKDFPDLLRDDAYRNSIMQMRQWFASNRPNLHPADGWLPIWLIVHGMNREITDYELSLALLYMAKHRGADWLDSNSDTDFIKTFKQTNSELSSSGKNVYEFMMNRLGGTERISLGTISRTFYVSAIEMLLTEQEKHKQWLTSRDVLERVVNDMYRNNKTHREKRLTKTMSLKRFIIEDVIMFQRKGNQKSKIKKCPYEKKIINGTVYCERCICKSHPLYVTFVVWQTVNNLCFVDNETGNIVTFDKQLAFDYLFSTEKPSVRKLMEHLGIRKCSCKYGEDNKLPENKIMGSMIDVLKNSGMDSKKSASYDVLEELWNIIYSSEDYSEKMKGLKRFSKKHSLNWDTFSENIVNVPVMSVGYGSMSKKALQKILPYIKDGKTFNYALSELYGEEIIHPHCDSLDELRELFEEDCKNGTILPNNVQSAHYEFERIYKALSIIPDAIPGLIVCEGMNDAPKTKKEMMEQNERLRRNRKYKTLKDAIIRLLKAKDSILNIDKITVYIDYCVSNYQEVFASLNSIYKIDESEKKEEYEKAVNAFIILIDGKYRCPYNGETIYLNNLFTDNIEREHVLAESRTHNNSIDNFVLASREVNKLKSNMTPIEFIKTYGGKMYGIKTLNDYEKCIKEEYGRKKDKRKMQRLLSEDYEHCFKQYQKQMTVTLGKYFQGLLCSLYDDSRNSQSNRVINVSSDIIRMIKYDLTDINLKFIEKFVKTRLRKLDEFNSSQPQNSKEFKTLRYLKKTDNGDRIDNLDNPKRMDNRHHAMDAICCAMVSLKFLQTINISIKKGFSVSKKSLFNMLNSWTDISDDIMETLRNTEVCFISKRTRSRKKSGTYMKYDSDGRPVYAKTKPQTVVKRSLHKETIFSKKNDVYSLRSDIASVMSDIVSSALADVTSNFDSEKKTALKENKGILDKETAEKFLDVLKNYLEDTLKTSKDIIDILYKWAKKNVLVKTPSEIFNADGIAEMNNHIDEIHGAKHHIIKKLKVVSKGEKKFSVGNYGKYALKNKGANNYAIILQKNNKRVSLIGDGDGHLFDESKLKEYIESGYKIVCEVRVGDCIKTNDTHMRIISIDETAGTKNVIHCVPNNWGNIEIGELQKRKTKTYNYNGMPFVDFISEENVVSHTKSRSSPK